jgi:hypothetical protein
MSKMVQYFAVATLALFLCAGAARAAGNEIRMAVERNAGPGALGELPAPTPPAEAKKDAVQAKKEAAEAKKSSAAKSDAPKSESSKPEPSKAAAKSETPKAEAAKAAAKPDTAPPLVKVPEALRAEPAPKKKAPRKKPAPKAEPPAENATAPMVDAVPGGPTAPAAAPQGPQGAPTEGAGAVPAVTAHPGDAQKQMPPAPVEKKSPARQAAAVPVPAPVPVPVVVPVPVAKPAPAPKPVPVVDPKAFVMPAGPSNALEPITLPTDTATGQFVGEVTLEFKADSVILRAATNGPVERTTHFNMDNPRKLAIDLRGPWRKKGGAVVRYDTGPVKVVVAGEHPDRLRLALEFREGAVRPEVSPTVELGPKGVTVTIPLAR